jgi:hypothetical protein
MVKIKYVAAGLTGAALISAGIMGIASAATLNPNVGSSGIPKTVFGQEKLDAAAEVLDTTTQNVQAAHQDKDLGKLISSAGLTRKTFIEKVKTELTTDLESKGYSQDQITIALQHKTIQHLRHHGR